MTEPASTPSTPATEDSFFVLRDVRALLEKRMTEVGRRAGLGFETIIQAFANGVGEAHDALAGDKQRDGFEVADSLTASHMTLMCDADLELDIRIGEISKKLVELSANELWRAHQRYITLLKRPEMKPDANPVGLDAISSGFRAVCTASSGDHARKMELLDRLVEVLSTDLPVIYEEINDLLERHGVEVAQTQIVQSPSSNRPHVSSGNAGGYSAGASASSTGDALGALQQALGAQFGGTAIGGFGSGGGSGGGTGGSNVALSAATLVMLNQLSARLDQLQRTTFGNTEAEMSDTVLRAIKASDLDVPLGNPEGIALETLGHIFDAIFNIWDLPDTVKTALGRLQIPLVRLSLTDSSLFSDERHPARRLINAIGRVSVGLPRDVARSHPVSSQVWKIASAVSERLHEDPSVVMAPLAELEALIAERDADVRAEARPFIDHLVAKESEAKNAELARQWLNEIAQQPSPREIHDFLRQYWLQVMEFAALIGGATGPLWIDAAGTAADLMWSVQPKTDADDRKRLANLVPGLIRKLNAGLDQIGVTQADRKPFLDACFNLQTASLRGTPAPTVVPDPDETASAVLASASNVPSAPEKVGSQMLHWIKLPGSETASYRSGAPGCQVGHWLQIAHENGELYTGLIAWMSPKLSVTLLYNPDWSFALAISFGYLDQAKRNGKLQIVSDRSIFDLAAQQALNQLTAGNG